MKNNSAAEIYLRPIYGGTIFVFNTIQSGMYHTVIEQINELVSELKNDQVPIKSEFFVVFGPFDNVIRLDVDDFCPVNRISSLPGISSQQIQCAYTIWDSINETGKNAYWKPFFCITQLKIQNHLMLGCGPEIEEAIAELLVESLREAASREQEIELMATLGWDEYFIFMRNSRGYESLFKPIVEKIRSLSLKDLEPFLEKKKFKLHISENNKPEHRHLFLSSYTTAGYSLELCNYLENHFIKKLGEKEYPDFLTIKQDEIDKLFDERIDLLPSFGKDKICVSSRLSIKPGHYENVRYIIDKVLGRDNKKDKKEYDSYFSIGRYDIYAWLREEMTCKEFIVWFGLLMFSLAGNLKRDEKDYRKFLIRSQYYTTFTIISCINVAPDNFHSLSDAPYMLAKEGVFFGQLKNLCLGNGENRKSIAHVFETRDLLMEEVPHSIVIGLARIFSLFDSCIMNRFICESFIDMYPFMQRIREIIDTVRYKKDGQDILEFTADNEKKEIILLQESRRSSTQDTPLVRVFYEAIQHFYRGFSHRYLSSYPMMDKNEIGVDFSGRLHRVLSAVTGMQNLILDDLDCHLKKGFNVISPYPNVRIHRCSFNITETNVFHLFQPEIFCSLYHEIMHTFIHSNALKELKDGLNEMVKMAPLTLPSHSIEDISLLIQELVGDIFLIKNAFYSNFELYSFWYWLLLVQSRKKVDSHIILRFLLISAVADDECKKIIFGNSKQQDFFSLEKTETLMDIIEQLISRLTYPPSIKDDIMNKIRNFYKPTPEDIVRHRVVFAFAILFPAVEGIYPLLKQALDEFSYPPPGSIEKTIYEFCSETPLPPEPSREKDKPTRRQWSSIRMFRSILTFIYEHRKHLVCTSGSILNFSTQRADLRNKLFKYRLALINTLQWEALHWKKNLLEKRNVTFHIQVEHISDEGMDK